MRQVAGPKAGDVVNLSIMIGGEAGSGIATAGEVLAHAYARCGLTVAGYSEVPSLIRGGHNSFQLCISTDDARSIWEGVDFLIAFDRLSVDTHAHGMRRGGSIVYDGEGGAAALDAKALGRDDLHLMPVPLTAIAKARGSAEVMRNTVALGVAIALSRYDFGMLEGVLRDQFKGKGEKVVEDNVASARAGYDYVLEHYPKDLIRGLEGRVCGLPRRVMTGNHAIGLGALRAGMTFYSGYPMTPASPLLHWLITKEEGFGLVVKQTEDEISAICMAIGASAAGARAMTGTSGGGFCLMTEGLGLAGEAEVPLVVMEGQRPGPSTGMATRTEQADLFFVIHASQGEFPRAVLTPGDNLECYHAALLAFDLAERYQTPVLILGDRLVLEGLRDAPQFEHDGPRVDRGKLLTDDQARAAGPDYRRYAVTPDGVSPRARWGQPGVVVTCNGNEHDEFGDSDEGAENRTAMVDKRARKLEGLRREVPKPVRHGPDRPDATLVGWGSTKGPALEALRMLGEQGERGKVGYLHFPSVWPMDREVVARALAEGGRLVAVEGNPSGQLAELLAREVCVRIPDRVLRYDGRPLTPDFIVRGLRGIEGLKGLMGW